METVSSSYGPQISVVGSSRSARRDNRRAREVGRELGKANAVLVCGGGGGVMESACRGLRESESGLAVGILKEGRTDPANPYLDVVIPTGVGHARNLSVVLAGRAVIAVGGRWGTLSEIAFAHKFNRPVFGVGTWEHPEFGFPGDLTPERAVEEALDAAGSGGT